MLKLWLIQLFWLALALPGYALLERWDPESLRRGFLFALGRCYLASLMLLTPVSVLGYWRHWSLWSLACAYLAGVAIGAVAIVRDRHALFAALRKPSLLAALSCVLIGFDLWLGLRAGAHTQGDAGYHIARVRMLIAEGLSNWDPIVAQPRLDIIYHTNLYHALIAVSGLLTRSDAALAWLATWPFAKLLVAAGVGQLACCVFGSASYAWLASIAVLASQSAYSALPFPNTLAPIALLPMGLCAAAELSAGGERSPLAAAWLAASAMALAQLHALNAIFLAMVVGPVLLALLVTRYARSERRASQRALVLGLLACGASLPWLVVAGAERMEVLLQLAVPTLQTAAPLPQPTAQHADAAQPEVAQPESAAPSKEVYKAERFRKLPNGMSVYEPDKLRGFRQANLVLLGVLIVTLALRPPRQLGALAAFVAMTCAWLLVPALCSVLLFVTGAPWAALRISQVLPVAFYTLVPGALMFWWSRLPRLQAWTVRLQPVFAVLATMLGLTQLSHGEPWTSERVWEHALHFEAQTQWQGIADKRALLCANIPPGEVVMAHPRWDYALPMHCRNFAIALSPGRGWHGLPYMMERRADVDAFFNEGTSGPRRLELMRKYAAGYVYTSQRLARRIVRSLPKQSRILAEARAGAVLQIDTQSHKGD